MPINDLPRVNPATVSAEIPSHLRWRPTKRNASPAKTSVVDAEPPLPQRPTDAGPSGPLLVQPRLPMRSTMHTDATDAMPLARDPSIIRAVVHALQRAHAQLPQSERKKESKGQTVATWLRNQNFAGLNDALQDVVLRRFAANSGKLPRAGIKTAFGWLSDAQIEGLTALLARRYTYQGLSDWLADEQSLTADVSAALYPPI